MSVCLYGEVGGCFGDLKLLNKSRMKVSSDEGVTVNMYKAANYHKT